MNPEERSRLEAAYDSLYRLYDSGDIRPAEMAELTRLDDMLRPIWTSEAAPADPTLQARDLSARESVAGLLSPAFDVLPGVSERGAYGMADRVAGLMDFLPFVGGAMSAEQARRDFTRGDYGTGAMNTAFSLMDVVPGVAALRGGGKATAKTLREGMIDVADHPIARDYFARQLNEARASHGPIGQSVDVYSPDEYAGMRMGMTPAGDAGYVVKPDGEIASVVKAKDSPIRDFSGSVLRRSEPEGGSWLNAFDTALPGLYGRGGFQPVSRLPFAEDIARGDWGDEATDAFIAANSRYSGGRPDLVFMARNPASGAPVAQGSGGLLTDDYDVAVQELERELKRLGYR